MKNVQIPETLLFALFRYFLIGERDGETAIRNALEDKLAAMQRRELYTQSYLASTPAEQEQARQAYLDKIGIPASFRWSREYEERRRKHE